MVGEVLNERKYLSQHLKEVREESGKTCGKSLAGKGRGHVKVLRCRLSFQGRARRPGELEWRAGMERSRGSER